jgi:tetratricopeptide (TPR) repeat protein
MLLVSRLRTLVALAALIAFAVPGRARAETQEGLRDPLAREFKVAGDAAMQSLRYLDALAAYERATEIEPHPSLLFNRGRALQALQRYPEALDHFEAFRAQAPSELLAKAGKLDELILRLRQQVSTLQILCNVKGATVLVRGHSVGVTPFGGPRRLNSGAATVTAQAEGYLPYERKIVLRGGEEESLEIRLVPRQSQGRITVRSAVTGAIVYVDGTRLGATPAESALASGRHSVRVQHPDYQSAETTFELHRGESKVLDIPLEQRPGLFKKWWFWTGAGVIAAAGVGLTVALLTERKSHRGDIPPELVSAPLLDF